MTFSAISQEQLEDVCVPSDIDTVNVQVWYQDVCPIEMRKETVLGIKEGERMRTR